MENGETLPQIMARSRHIILRHKSKWKHNRPNGKILFKESFPTIWKKLTGSSLNSSS